MSVKFCIKHWTHPREPELRRRRRPLARNFKTPALAGWVQFKFSWESGRHCKSCDPARTPQRILILSAQSPKNLEGGGERSGRKKLKKKKYYSLDSRLTLHTTDRGFSCFSSAAAIFISDHCYHPRGSASVPFSTYRFYPAILVRSTIPQPCPPIWSRPRRLTRPLMYVTWADGDATSHT